MQLGYAAYTPDQLYSLFLRFYGTFSVFRCEGKAAVRHQRGRALEDLGRVFEDRTRTELDGLIEGVGRVGSLESDAQADDVARFEEVRGEGSAASVIYKHDFHVVCLPRVRHCLMVVCGVD